MHSVSPLADLQTRDMEAAAVLIPGEGEMARAIREKDWSQTLLGPISGWPASILTAVNICLDSQFQLVVLCGPELIYLYNDASIPIFGDKHPWALGQRVADVWSEVWPTIGPMLQSVLSTGKATRHDDLLLVLQRRGFNEECYFTFSYSAVRVEGNGVGGVFVAVLETSERVINERRLRTLSDIATQVATGRGADSIFRQVREALSRNPYDVPFAALYLRDGDAADLVFCTGMEGNAHAFATRLPLSDESGTALQHPIVRAARAEEPLLFDACEILRADQRCGAWPEQPRQAMVLPFALPGQNPPHGFLVVGVNPRKALDDEYRAFFGLLAGHVATAVANVKAIEAERSKAEAIAELDRTKSHFFSNASHELRTPVTLILGPLEEILESDRDALPSGTRERLEMARRNARRLQKLVNSIMDFASIEAGRLLVRREATDVGLLTAEIASLFRSLIESAGLEFFVQSSIPETNVLIDPEMWEKVVLNLLSNAFKFTRSGRIDVVLRTDPENLYLIVSDTGIGIQQNDLPHIFDRFFRGRSTAGRSVEGSGIGLALVHELVRLHGGHIEVDSALGRGSRFTVCIPLHVGSITDGAGAGHALAGELRRAFIDEAHRFAPVASIPGVPMAGGAQPDPDRSISVQPDASAERMKVVIVDDNEDIVRYIERLLEDATCVISARDGVRGLEAIRTHVPDLVLMDLMMPGLDGFGLLKAIRADDTIRTVSVIVLSARAEEEARIEALAAGADDYLVKPFSARELKARIRSHVQMARLRRAALEREHELLAQITAVRHDLDRVLEGTTDAFASLDRDLRIVALNQTAAQIVNASKQDLVGRLATEVSPDLKGSKLETVLRRVIETGTPASVEHLHVQSMRWFNVHCYPSPHGVIAFGTDITEQKMAERKLIDAHAELERRVMARTRELQDASKLLVAVFDRAPGGIAITDVDGRFVRANTAYQKLVGYTEQELAGLSMETLVGPEASLREKAMLAKLRDRECESLRMELQHSRPDGEIIWLDIFISSIDDEQGGARYFVKMAQDISDRKRAECELVASQQELRVLYDRLQSVREEERVALAREVHDQLGQILSAAKIDIKLLEDDIRPHEAHLSRRRIAAELRSARQTIDKAIQLVRQIATELRASELEDQGLYAAIKWHSRDFERRTRIPCKVSFASNVREPTGAIAIALFRIFQESMTNILRHAKASHVFVNIARSSEFVLLRVRDDGIGISARNVRNPRSIGLMGMRERAAIAGGRLFVRALRGGGTLVAARIPLNGLHAEGTCAAQDKDVTEA